MKDILIRKIRRTDMDGVLRLLETREELNYEKAKKRTKLVEWLAFNNPFSGGEPTYYIAEQSGKIIALNGRMPTKLVVHGKIINAMVPHDLYVHPEKRKDGTGFWLSMNFANSLEKENQEIILNMGMTSLARRMGRLRHYYEFPDNFSTYKKFLNPQGQLKKVLKLDILVKILNPIAKLALNVLDFFLFRKNDKNIDIIEITKFDARFDKFNKEILHKIGISSFKDASYLNWKYIDRPFKVATVYAAVEDLKIQGYIVVALSSKNWRRKNPEGAIIDIMCNPQNKRIIRALCKAAVVHFRKCKVHAIACILTDLKIAAVFKKLLFFQRQGGRGFMLGNLEKNESMKVNLMNINNWHITLGESDWYMLNTD